MRALYRVAAARRASVDHIIPLKGRDVSGLHVPWNLRIVARSENSRKGNRVGDGAPGEIRTPDPVVRSHVLYPAELRARNSTEANA